VRERGRRERRERKRERIRGKKTYARSRAPESGGGDGDGEEEEEKMETTMLHLLCEIETMGLDGRAVRECRPLSARLKDNDQQPPEPEKMRGESEERRGQR